MLPAELQSRVRRAEFWCEYLFVEKFADEPMLCSLRVEENDEFPWQEWKAFTAELGG